MVAGGTVVVGGSVGTGAVPVVSLVLGAPVPSEVEDTGAGLPLHAARLRLRAAPDNRATRRGVNGRMDRRYPVQPGAPNRRSRGDGYGWPVNTPAIPVVLDVDTGVDDACAILLAAGHPALDLRAVTCVGGNAPVDDVVRNTLITLDAAGRADVPVARGAERPLLEEPVDARHVHGQDGMADLGWRASERVVDSRHAVELLRDVCREAAASGEGVTLIPLAPLTNIALLLRTYPDAAQGISRIVFMGGSAAVGNATASAEFNVFHDPEAAAIALDAARDLGIPVTMYGLDVFYEPQVTRAEAEALIAVGGHSGAELAGRLVAYQCDRFESDSATIGDAGAVAAVIAPDLVTVQTLPMRIELAGTWSRGRTIVDRRDWSGDLSHDPHGEPPFQLEVALGVDAERVARLWIDTVGGER